VFELPSDRSAHNRVKWLLSKWEVDPSMEVEGLVKTIKKARQKREETVQETSWKEEEGQDVLKAQEAELEAEKAGKDSPEIQGASESDQEVPDGSGGVLKGEGVEGGGASVTVRKGKWRQIKDWGLVKYKKHRYKYDPRA